MPIYLGQNIKHLRKEKKWSQTDISEKIGGKSHQMVGKYENGTSFPPLEILVELAKVFEVSVGDLVEKDLTKEEPSGRVEEPEVPYGTVGPLIKALGEAQERYKELLERIRQEQPELLEKWGL